MKTIRLYRNNEFANNLLDVDVFVNGEKHTLSTNSSVNIRFQKGEEVDICAKCLWVRSKKLSLNDSNKSYRIGIKPYMADKWLFVQVTVILLMYVLFVTTNLTTFEFLAKVTGISFMALLFYFISFGKNRYFKLAVESQ